MYVLVHQEGILSIQILKSDLIISVKNTDDSYNIWLCYLSYCHLCHNIAKLLLLDGLVWTDSLCVLT